MFRSITAILLLLGVVSHAQTLDTIVFGDTASETAHNLVSPFTAVETAALGQSARRMFIDPANAAWQEGGHLEFTAKCDPVADNFVTVKLWGSDYARTASGVLMAYLIENGVNYQVGYKDQHNGGSDYSIQLSEFALFAPVTLLAPPSSAPTLVPGDRQATVSWPAVSGATGYVVSRSIYHGGPYRPQASIASGTNFVDTNLLNGTRYHYVVRTTSADGQGQNSDPASVLVEPAPGAPTGLTAIGGANRVTLQWPVVPGATSYAVRGGLTAGGPYAPITGGLMSPGFIHAGLGDGVTRYYVITATNAAGTSVDSAEAAATTHTAIMN